MILYYNIGCTVQQFKFYDANEITYSQLCICYIQVWVSDEPTQAHPLSVYSRMDVATPFIHTPFKIWWVLSDNEMSSIPVICALRKFIEDALTLFTVVPVRHNCVITYNFLISSLLVLLLSHTQFSLTVPAASHVDNINILYHLY